MRTRRRSLAGAAILIAACTLRLLVTTTLQAQAQAPTPAQAAPPTFGGGFAELDMRQQRLVADWVSRVNGLTGQNVAVAAFYDDQLRLSSKTTFDAITNALITTRLTDDGGTAFGDALDLIDRVDTVKGQVFQASGDQQYRMFVRLKDNAIASLDRSREFRRGADNTIFHRGYPINYRQQGGTPSIQISIAQDRRRADVDVDYRTSMFPVSLFNGHLTSSNSDVRAGGNYDRHVNRWASGFQSWWRNLFAARKDNPGDSADRSASLVPATPRAGDKTIDVMANDFLTAWLIDGDMPGALSYISERAYACLAEDEEDFDAFDRGLAPFELMVRMKAAREELGPRRSLEGLLVGVRMTLPGLRVVTQSHHAQFVIYSVRNDVAASFDCESRHAVGAPGGDRGYGRYFGTTFFVDGRRDTSLALLWAEEGGYWKVVSWKAEPDDGGDTKDADLVPAVPAQGAIARADQGLVTAARDFLESWLLRKDYDRAISYLSPATYACYNLTRNPNTPPAASLADAAPLIRMALASTGMLVGSQTRLDRVLTAAPPTHTMVRLLSHPNSRTFALSSVPNALAAAVDCSVRARGERFSGEIPSEYGQAYAMATRLLTRSGETPILKTLWMREAGAWRITSYDVEQP